jgi:hypothetical protein
VLISDASQSLLWKTRIATIGERDPAPANGIANLINGREGSFRISFQGLEDRGGNRGRFIPAQFGDQRDRDGFGPISGVPTQRLRTLWWRSVPRDWIRRFPVAKNGARVIEAESLGGR